MPQVLRQLVLDGYQGENGVPIDIKELIAMVYKHSRTWQSREEIDEYADMIAEEFGTKAGNFVRASNEVGDTICYIGLSAQKGGGLKRLKQYSHGHIGVFTRFCARKPEVIIHSQCRFQHSNVLC